MITVLGELKKGNVYAKNVSIELKQNEAFWHLIGRPVVPNCYSGTESLFWAF